MKWLNNGRVILSILAVITTISSMVDKADLHLHIESAIFIAGYYIVSAIEKKTKQ